MPGIYTRHPWPIKPPLSVPVVPGARRWQSVPWSLYTFREGAGDSVAAYGTAQIAGGIVEDEGLSWGVRKRMGPCLRWETISSLGKGDRVSWSLPTALQDPSQLTVIVFGQVDSDIGAGTPVFAHRSESTRLIQMTAQSATELRLQMRGSGGSLESINVSGLDLTRPRVMGAVFDKTNSSHSLWLDGLKVGSNSHNFGSETFTSTLQALGNFNSGAWNGNFKGRISTALIVHAALTDEEMASLATPQGLLDLYQPRRVFVPGLSNYESTVLGLNPVAYYRLGESSGTTANDSSGNGYDGTYTNTPTLGVTGLLSADADTAVTFDSASSEYVSVDVSGGTYWGTLGSSLGSGFSCSFLLNVSSSSGVIDPLGGASSGGTRINVQIDATPKITVQLRDDSAAFTSGSTGTLTIRDGEDHHVVISVDPATDTILVWIDGASESISYNLQDTPSNFSDLNSFAAVGAGDQSGSLGDYFDGTLDEVAIYNKVLNSTEAGDLFTASGLSSGGSLLLFIHHYRQQGFM